MADTSIFEEYIKDLTFLATDVRNNIQELQGGQNFEALSKTIKTVLDQATELIKQAEIEARSHESRERKALNDKLRQHKDIFATLQSDFDTENFRVQKSQLTGRSGEDRGRMLETNEKYDNCVFYSCFISINLFYFIIIILG